MNRLTKLQNKVLSEIEAINYCFDMEQHSIDLDILTISNLSREIKRIENNIIDTKKEKVFLSRILEILEKIKDESDIIEVSCRLTDIDIMKEEQLINNINRKLEEAKLGDSIESYAYGKAESIQKDLVYRAGLNDEEEKKAWKIINGEF